MLKDKIITSFFTSSLTLITISLFLSFNNFSNLPAGTLLITRFNSGRGIGNFGGLSSLVAIILSVLILVLLNLLLARIFFYRLKPIAYFSGFCSLVLSVLILIHVGVIISVN